MEKDIQALQADVTAIKLLLTVLAPMTLYGQGFSTEAWERISEQMSATLREIKDDYAADAPEQSLLDAKVAAAENLFKVIGTSLSARLSVEAEDAR